MQLLEAVTPNYSALTSALSSAITPEMVLALMGTIVGATAGIFLVKWGGSKIISAFQSVLKRGRIRA